MVRKKKRANKKITKEKPLVVTSNEQAFLNFVDQNAKQNTEFNEVDQSARQNSGFNEFCVGKFGEIDSGSESSSSASSSSGHDGSLHVDSGDEPALDRGVQKSVKKRGRPPKKGKVINKAMDVQDKSSKGLHSTCRKGKQTDMPPHDPTYNKEELKACFAVIKKIMEMDEAKSFNSPVDPASLGLHDYFAVVDTPMDFGTICKNLQNGVKYLNGEDVYKDVQYIWENCLKYNKKGDYIVYLMKRVKKKFMKYWTAAGLKSEILTKTSGHSHFVLSNDHAIRLSQCDAMSVVNHVVCDLKQMQQNDFGIIHTQSQVPLPSYSQPYQSHQPQSQVPLSGYSLPCQLHQPQYQVPLPCYSQHYQSHQPQSQVPLPGYSQPYQLHQPPGNPHLLPSNDHSKRHSKGDTISMVSHAVSSQTRPDSFGTVQALSQVPQYHQPCQPHQPQLSNTQPQLFQSQAVAESNCAGNHIVGNHMQQDNFGTSQSRSQMPLPGFRQPCPSHQPQPSTDLPPQLSHSQAGADSNNSGHSKLAALMGRSTRQKKYATRHSMVSMMSGPTHSKQQQPQPSSCHLWQSQQSTSQEHVGVDIDGAGHPPLPTVDCPMEQNGYVPVCLVDPVDCAMEHNGDVPGCPVGPVVVNQSELHAQQPPLSCNQPNVPHQPESSIGQPQPSQPLTSLDISSPGLANTSGRGRRNTQRSSEDPCTRTPLVSGCHSPQQPSGSHSHPDSPEQPTQKTKKRTRVRGPTLCRDMWDMCDGEQIAVPINTLGQPVGPEASKLSTFLGTVARNGEMAPLTFVDWFAMPDEKKENMWQFVQTKFDIEPVCKTWVLRSLASKWRNWKAKLKSEHYYPHKTDEERLNDRDRRVLPEQWAILISYWNSEEAQLRSAKNKANRSNQKSTHTAGSKSFARIREEERTKKSGGKEPTRAELYIKTRTRKDGQPMNNVAAEIISKLREQETQKQQTSNDSNDWDDAFFQVMGEEKNGHVRTYGLGPNPSDLWGQKLGHIELIRMASEAKKSANEEVSKMLGKMEAMEKKYASMETQIARMASSMQNFFEKMGAGEPSKGLGSKQAQEHSSSSSHEVPSNEIDRGEM